MGSEPLRRMVLRAAGSRLATSPERRRRENRLAHPEGGAAKAASREVKGQHDLEPRRGDTETSPKAESCCAPSSPRLIWSRSLTSRASLSRLPYEHAVPPHHCTPPP